MKNNQNIIIGSLVAIAILGFILLRKPKSPTEMTKEEYLKYLEDEKKRFDSMLLALDEKKKSGSLSASELAQVNAEIDSIQAQMRKLGIYDILTQQSTAQAISKKLVSTPIKFF